MSLKGAIKKGREGSHKHPRTDELLEKVSTTPAATPQEAKKATEKTKFVSFRVTPARKQALKVKIAAEGRTLDEVLNDLVADYLER